MKKHIMMRPRRKTAASVEDLFNNEGLAVVGFKICKDFHPRFRSPKFAIPLWLKKYQIVHFVGDKDNPVVAKAVHKLYHVVLDNDTDRLHMASALAAGETLAIVRQGTEPQTRNAVAVAVAATTFARIGNKVLVLYIAIDERYRTAGFGTQLLMLMGQCVQHRGNGRVSMFLFANQGHNEKAWNFYVQRGFKLAPPQRSESIQEFLDHPELCRFANNEDVEDLQLLCLENLETFKCGHANTANTPLCFLLDPHRPMHEVVDDPMVYAQFPGTLSLADCNHCGKDLTLLQQNYSCEENDVGPVGIWKGYPKSQFVVSWSSRLEIRTGVTLLNPTVSMLLAWIQRDGEAGIWKNRVTLVPPCVMLSLWNMHFLFQRYLQACLYTDSDFDEMKRATFHPEFDNERFIDCAQVVVTFIRGNHEDLFEKPYIVMFGEDLDMDWTCFVSVNAGTIGTGVGEQYKRGGGKVCGFINYNPNAADEDFRCNPIRGDDPYLFFLTLARHVLARTTLDTTSHNEEVVLFQDITQFQVFLNQAEVSFGEPYVESMNERSSFGGDCSFVQLALPHDYPLRLDLNMDHLSKLAAILFFNDFCVSVASKYDFHWRPCTGAGIVGRPLSNDKMYTFAIPKAFPFGSSLQRHVSVSKTRKKNATNYRALYGVSSERIIYLTLNSVIVLIDRIACIGYGERRTSREEYKKYLHNREVPGIADLPPPSDRLTDRCHVMNWTPNHPSSSKSQTSSENGICEESSDAKEGVATIHHLSSSDNSDSSSSRDDDNASSSGDGHDSDARSGSNGHDSDARLGSNDHDSDASSDSDGRDSNASASGDNSSSDGHVSNASSSGDDDNDEKKAIANEEIDPRLKELEDGQPVPLELDLLYEGFEEGQEGTRPVNEVANGQSIHQLGSLPRISCQPPELDALLSTRRKTPPTKKRPRTSKDFVAVGPMSNTAKKQSRKSFLDSPPVQGDPMAICVEDDLCHRPGGSSSLLDLVKCAPCSKCDALGHFICLRKYRNLRLCSKCYQAIVRQRAIQKKARTALDPKQDSTRDGPNHLEPPAELLPSENFVRPNITKRMKDWLNHELSLRGFLTENDMRVKILDHNAKIKHLQEDPNSVSRKDQIALKEEASKMRMLISAWRKCHRTLRQEYVRDTRCCVKELRYDSKDSNFVARMEWEDSAINIETGEEITVLNTETMVVKDKWVRSNFTQGTYNYLKKISRLAKGKFMPVPHADVIVDTRQVSHFKWAVSKDHPDGRWIVKFANSDDTEEMAESELLETVGLSAMTMAKTFASGRGGFLPIPVGNSTKARTVGSVSDVVITFRQHDRQTCIYSSFASALWFLGLEDVALLVVSHAASSEGDPWALKRLASLVHDHPTWLIPKKIKSAATSFNLLEHDLTNSLAVVVLKSIPDGACNHAISVHDGLIFDGNEDFAIPLTRANLDFMCSTDTRAGKYECVTSGYLFIDSRKGQTGFRDSKIKSFAA